MSIVHKRSSQIPSWAIGRVHQVEACRPPFWGRVSARHNNVTFPSCMCLCIHAKGQPAKRPRLEAELPTGRGVGSACGRCCVPVLVLRHDICMCMGHHRTLALVYSQQTDMHMACNHVMLPCAGQKARVSCCKLGLYMYCYSHPCYVHCTRSSILLQTCALHVCISVLHISNCMCMFQRLKHRCANLCLAFVHARAIHIHVMCMVGGRASLCKLVLYMCACVCYTYTIACACSRSSSNVTQTSVPCLVMGKYWRGIAGHRGHTILSTRTVPSQAVSLSDLLMRLHSIGAPAILIQLTYYVLTSSPVSVTELVDSLEVFAGQKQYTQVQLLTTLGANNT
jgi:hypothetical protein